MSGQPVSCRVRRGAWWLAVLLVAAACSGPYTRQQAVPPQYRLTVPEGIRVAAHAMQTVGYFPVKQDVGAGYIVGEQKRKDSFGVDMFSLSLSVSFLPAGEGRLNVSATAAVSENIVLTDELDDEVDKFYGAFQRTLEPDAPGPAGAPAGTRPVGPLAPGTSAGGHGVPAVTAGRALTDSWAVRRAAGRRTAWGVMLGLAACGLSVGAAWAQPGSGADARDVVERFAQRERDRTAQVWSRPPAPYAAPRFGTGSLQAQLYERQRWLHPEWAPAGAAYGYCPPPCGAYPDVWPPGTCPPGVWCR